MGSSVTNNGVMVTDGLFTAVVDFGAGMMDGTARWLEVAVRSAGSGAEFTRLDPRQPLAPAPNAQYALTPAAPQGPEGAVGPLARIEDTSRCMTVMRKSGGSCI